MVSSEFGAQGVAQAGDEYEVRPSLAVRLPVCLLLHGPPLIALPNRPRTPHATDSTSSSMMQTKRRDVLTAN
jgi:hypothetical protein